MSYDGSGYSGWDSWYFPVKLRGYSFEVAEDSGGDFNNPDRVVQITLSDDTYYADKEIRTGTASLLPGRPFYRDVKTELNNSTLSNSYDVSPFQPSGYNERVSVELSRTSGSDDFQLRFNNSRPGWWGYKPGRNRVIDSSGVIQGEIAHFGAWHVHATLSQDQRGWPVRSVSRTRGDTVEGFVNAGPEWTRRFVEYIQLASVDVWPSRSFQSEDDQPLVDSDAYDQSDLYSATVENDPNSAFRDLYRYAGRRDEVIVRWGATNLPLLFLDYTYDVGTLEIPDRIFEAIADTEPGERYDVEMTLDTRDTNRAH